MGLGSSGTIRASREVGAVVRTGRPRHGGRMVLYVLASGGPTRAAFVSSRNVGGAVDRNRARRLLREAWRSLLPEVHEGYDVVVMARPGIRDARMQDVLAEMADALRAAGVITE